jgi:transcriptional regulator with XRE-family HTH domain
VNFAKTFQLLRIRYGLTQEQFADQTGLGAISDIETGRQRDFSISGHGKEAETQTALHNSFPSDAQNQILRQLTEP